MSVTDGVLLLELAIVGADTTTVQGSTTIMNELAVKLVEEEVAG